jgi:hypothetical protein
MAFLSTVVGRQNHRCQELMRFTGWDFRMVYSFIELNGTVYRMETVPGGCYSWPVKRRTQLRPECFAS